MKTALIIFVILIIACIFLLFNIQKNSRTLEATGLIDGKLSKCSTKPNCVCSEVKDDSKHYINSIVMPNNTINSLILLKNTIKEMGGNIQVSSDNYIAATFTSAIFKFVDDLEIRIDTTEKAIHIRSASRVGYSDMGVNKKRTESLKNLFSHKVSIANK